MRPARPAGKGPRRGSAAEGDIISSEEWVRMSRGLRNGAAAAGAVGERRREGGGNRRVAAAAASGDFLLGRNSREADLNVPTDPARARAPRGQGD